MNVYNTLKLKILIINHSICIKNYHISILWKYIIIIMYIKEYRFLIELNINFI